MVSIETEPNPGQSVSDWLAACAATSTSSERAAYGETILQVLAHSAAPSTLLALGMAEHARDLFRRTDDP